MNTMLSPCFARKAARPFARGASAAALAAVAGAAFAAPPGWTTDLLVSAVETSGADLVDYPVRLVVDTAALIAAGEMRPDAGDLRFAVDAAGTQALPYWIEGGIGTASTVVWVRLPSIPADWAAGFHLFGGNPAATSESTLGVFGFVGEQENSATLQVAGGDYNSIPNSQRGFRFSPNEDVLLTHLGKNEPGGTTRYLTLFDAETQAKIAQEPVSGAAATYAYAPLAQPLWLRRGKVYLLEMYQGEADGYYFGAAPQMNPRLTYLDMRFCNACTKDTFPTNFVAGLHYGYPDFLFRTRAQAASEPDVAFGPGPTRTTVTGSVAESAIGTPVTFTASVRTLFEPAPGASFGFRANGSPVAGCTDLPPSATVPPTVSCTIDTLPLGVNGIEATWSGDAGNQGSASDVLSHTVFRRATQTSLAASASTAEFGTPVTFTASTSAGIVLGQVPGGTFSFRADGSPLDGCANVAPAGTDPPTASCKTNALSLGAHTVEASWSGDAAHEGSTSKALTYTVARLATQTLLATGCAPVFVENQPLTLHAAVTARLAPIGRVSFEQDGTTLCQGVPLVAGVASCIADALSAGGQPLGVHHFSASYAGDGVNAPSTSALLGVTVLSEAEAVMRDGFDPRPEGCPLP